MDDNATQIISLLITSLTTIAVAWFKLREGHKSHPPPAAPPAAPPPPPTT